MASSSYKVGAMLLIATIVVFASMEGIQGAVDEACFKQCMDQCLPLYTSTRELCEKQCTPLCDSLNRISRKATPKKAKLTFYASLKN